MSYVKQVVVVGLILLLIVVATCFSRGLVLQGNWSAFFGASLVASTAGILSGGILYDIFHGG